MPPRIRQPASLTLSLPSPQTHCTSCLARAFSTTPQPQITRRRRQMFAWLSMVGSNFKEAGKGTNYLGAYDLRSGKKLDRNKTRSQRERRPLRGQEKERDEAEEGEEEAEEEKEEEEEQLSDDSRALEEAAIDDVRKPRKKDQKEDNRALRPFPLNPHFLSQSILSESLRLEVWRRVQMEKKSVREVSVELGIDMRRVGAVVRLVEVEKKMTAANQPLALPYARAIHSILPVTPFSANSPPTPHEPINDLPSHPLTYPQLFYPTSESRAFNRTDAGRVFSSAPRLPDSADIGQGGSPAKQPWEDTTKEIIGRPLYPDTSIKKGVKGSGKHSKSKGQGQIEVLKPADARIPHPHMIAHELDRLNPALKGNAEDIRKRYMERLARDEQRIAASRLRKKEMEEAMKQRVQSERWEWVVTDFSSTGAGTEANGARVGERYGVPSQDRKRGQIKIPRKVEV